MSRVSVALLACGLALNSFSAMQLIEADSGPNFIAVELQVGDNKLTDLFPSVPVGTLVFKWDNATGWKAAQMYSIGWSHPNEVIRPWEGAVMYLPADKTVSVTLTGEIVPLPPPPVYTLGSSWPGARVHRGLNLVSARFAKHVAERARETASLYWFNENLGSYLMTAYDSLTGGWMFGLLPNQGAVWYQSEQAPVNPSGTFSPTGVPLYFNNYAPAFGIDAKFRGVDCEPITSGTAQLFRHQQFASDPIGAEVNFTSAFPGYFDPTADLVRYVPGGAEYFVRMQGGVVAMQTPNAIAPPANVPPFWPGPIEVFVGNLAFRSQPEDVAVRPGNVIELPAVFHHAIAPADLLDVPYQWQKQTESGWIDIPDAMNATLRIENAQAEDAGVYRLRAMVCDEYYSRTATVTLIAPLMALEFQASGKIRLQVTLPVTTKAVVQTSTDLEEWSDAITIGTAVNEWTGEVDVDGGARFYRVVETP